MSGSGGCLLEFGAAFERSLQELEKVNYNKKDTKGRAEVRALIKSVLERLLDWPAVAGSHPEPYPPKCGDDATRDGWLLHKVEFHPPRAKGPAGCGRLIYLVNKNDRVVVPLVVYTHKQFPGRVPNQSLEDLIEAARSAHHESSEKKKELLAAAGSSDPEST